MALEQAWDFLKSGDIEVGSPEWNKRFDAGEVYDKENFESWVDQWNARENAMEYGEDEWGRPDEYILDEETWETKPNPEYTGPMTIEEAKELQRQKVEQAIAEILAGPKDMEHGGE